MTNPPTVTIHLKAWIVLMVILAAVAVVYGADLGRASTFIVASVAALALVVFFGWKVET